MNVAVFPVCERDTNVIDITWRPAGATELEMTRIAAEVLAGHPGHMLPGDEQPIVGRVLAEYEGRLGGAVHHVFFVSWTDRHGSSWGRQLFSRPGWHPRRRTKAA